MRRKAITLSFIAVGCALALLLWPDSSCKRVLPDGTVLVLSGVKIGRTNTYAHGTRLSKIKSLKEMK